MNPDGLEPPTFCTELRIQILVPWAGLEPARLAAGDFESPASTNSATRALVFSLLLNMVSAVGFEPMFSHVQGERINQTFPHTDNFSLILVCVVGFEPTVSRVRGEWINQIFPHTVILTRLEANRDKIGFNLVEYGRCERIRTFDPLHPMQVRYQAAPHTEFLNC